MRTSRLQGTQALHDVEERSYELTLAVVELVRQVEHELPQALSDRIIVAATNFGVDVSEAVVHSTPKTQISKLVAARRTTREMAFLLRVLKGIQMAAEPGLRPLIEEAAALQDEITSLILRTRQEVERES
ncbi:MAG: four helix bundle protein [Candidatus Hydrogenedentota bacterium]